MILGPPLDSFNRPVSPLTLKDWDNYGARCRSPFGDYVDLSRLSTPVLPATLPSLLHFYRERDGSLLSIAATCRTQPCRGYAGAEKLLRTPGLKYLMYICDISDSSTGPEYWHLRMASFPAGEQTEGSLVVPITVNEILAKLGGEVEHPLDRFPHRCPRCAGPAYVGLNSIDCMRGCAW